MSGINNINNYEDYQLPESQASNDSVSLVAASSTCADKDSLNKIGSIADDLIAPWSSDDKDDEDGNTSVANNASTIIKVSFPDVQDLLTSSNYRVVSSKKLA